MAKRRIRSLLRPFSVRRASSLARQLQGATGAALQPWLKAWQSQASEVRDKWVHDHTMPAARGRWLPGMALAAGGHRQFQLYLPAGTTARQRLPLMVMLHGCQQDAATFAHSTHMHKLADRDGFAVLYVQQDRRANAQGCWNWFDLRSGRALREAGLVLAAIDQVCLLHAIDPARVAVAGLSAGASLAALLAQHHGERFRAVVMHSGVPPGAAQDARGALGAMHGRSQRAATPTPGAAPWPPLLVIHGDCDSVVSPRNALQAVAQWAAAGHGRAAAPVTRQRGQRLPAEVARWTLAGRDVVTLVMVHGLGHAWSGGTAALPFGEPRGPDAAALAWRFAQRQWRS